MGVMKYFTSIYVCSSSFINNNIKGFVRKRAFINIRHYLNSGRCYVDSVINLSLLINFGCSIFSCLQFPSSVSCYFFLRRNNSHNQQISSSTFKKQKFWGNLFHFSFCRNREILFSQLRYHIQLGTIKTALVGRKIA